jgi:hypothetical protein
VAFGRAHGIDEIEKFRTLDNWKVFAWSLVHYLINKPIKFPDRLTPGSVAQRVYQSIMNKVPNPDFAVVEFMYTPDLKTGQLGYKARVSAGHSAYGPIAFVDDQIIIQVHESLRREAGSRQHP